MFSVKKVNHVTFIDTLLWCKTWPPNGSSRIRAKQKLLRKHKGACHSSWSQIGNLKSFTLTIPWNFGKACEDLSWNHCTSTPHRSETNAIAERAVRRIKEELLLYCCNRVWMKNGGQILWNVTLICETSQIYYLMGRRPMKDIYGNHLKDRLFHLIRWLSITLHLRKTSEESIN